MSQYYQKPHRGARGNPDTTRWPLWERYTVRAMVAIVFGKDYRRHLHRAKIAARRAEFEQSFERAQQDRRRRARI
jgi:hypothetical protein